jgi:hypothetical protein
MKTWGHKGKFLILASILLKEMALARSAGTIVGMLSSGSQVPDTRFNRTAAFGCKIGI